MSPKYIAFFVFLYVVGTVLGLIIEDGTVGVGQQSTLNDLLIWRQFDQEQEWGFVQIITFIPSYLGTIWKAAIWNFAFLQGGWIWLKWFIWTPLMAMFVWGVILTFISIFSKTLRGG